MNQEKKENSEFEVLDEEVDGVIAEFETPSDLIHVAKEARQVGGFTRYDCYSPFPIHGMDDAMGLGQSPLGYIVAAFGGTALLLATLMQWWMSAVDYPLVYSGKPLFSLPAFVPIMFELTVLTSAFTAVFGMLLLSKLPKYYHPVFHSDRFSEKNSNDGFFVVVYAWDKRFNVEEIKSFFKKSGGKNIAIIHRPMQEIMEERNDD